MSQNVDDFCAQWRASAHEAVPYTNDYPECFLVLPELIDGAIGQGCASKILIEIKFIDENKGYLKVTDNGIGVKNPNRLLSWASKEATSIHHRYGHGSKKCLTKWNKDYNAKWYIKYRFKRTKGVDSLFQYNSPFLGINTHFTQDDINETDLMPSGLEWFIEFNRNILNNKNTIEDTFDSIKEIIQTRYSRKFLNKIEFILIVHDDKKKLEENSKLNKWNTFEEAILNEIKSKNCVEILNKNIDFNPNTKVLYRIYYVTIYGGKAFDLKKEFPTYGQKNMNCSRIHISLNERVIEIAPLWKFMKDRDSNHNDYNGIFAFINFENIDNCDIINNYNDNLPTPCTTKVSFYENCKNFLKMKEILFEINNQFLNKKNLDKYKDDLQENTHQKIPLKINEKNKLNTIPKKVKKDIELSSESESESESESNSEEPIITKSKSASVDSIKKKNNEIKLSPVKKKNISKNIKLLIWDKYIGEDIIKHKCLCCKKREIKNTDFHCGHVIPESKGGKDTLENLRPICANCNLGMGQTNMIDYVKKHELFIG